MIKGTRGQETHGGSAGQAVGRGPCQDRLTDGGLQGPRYLFSTLVLLQPHKTGIEVSP